MSIVKSTWQCLFAPKLYKVYRDGPREGYNYQPRNFEKWGDNVISMALTAWKFGLYTSPLLCIYMYKKGLLTGDGTMILAKLAGSVGCLLALSLMLRSIGRATNPSYARFIQVLNYPSSDHKKYLDALRDYDFDFYAWPVTFSLEDGQRILNRTNSQTNRSDVYNMPAYKRLPVQTLAYIAVHTFGLRLIYPGSLSLVQSFVWVALLQGRTTLVELYNGKRTKLKTVDKNEVDCMFVDNRAASIKGKTLVICCEGNSGFYEIGIMTTPIKVGYSALGWNHPGFGGSTGLPYPDQEQNAMDTVMQYAIKELGFKIEDIVLFGWSIGGYTATWAAVNYPEIKALVLDATFDDLLPLAKAQMPASWDALVTEVVCSYVDLHVADLLVKYPGPVYLVRRTEDEIICLQQEQLSSNRGNYLVMKLLEHRHPELVGSDQISVVKQYLGLQEPQKGMFERQLGNLDSKTKEAVLLVSKYLKDYKSSHCTPLPEDVFQVTLDSVVSNRRVK